MPLRSSVNWEVGLQLNVRTEEFREREGVMAVQSGRERQVGCKARIWTSLRGS